MSVLANKNPHNGLLINGHAGHNTGFVSNNRVHDIDKGLQADTIIL